MANDKLLIDNTFTPVEPDPQYILQVNALKKYFPIKDGMIQKVVGYVKAVDGVTFNLKRGTTMGLANIIRNRALSLNTIVPFNFSVLLVSFFFPSAFFFPSSFSFLFLAMHQGMQDLSSATWD